MNQFSVLYMFDTQKVKHFTGPLVMHIYFKVGSNSKMLASEWERVDLFEQPYKLSLNLKNWANIPNI